MRPADGVVVEGLRRAEVVDPGRHEFGRLDVGYAVQSQHLVECASRCSLRRSTVVADDVVDQGVVESPEIFNGVNEPAEVMVCVLEKTRVHLHLAGENGFQVVGHFVPARNLVGARRQFGVIGDYPELFLAGKGPLSLSVPAVIEPTLVLCRPLLWNVMWSVSRAWCPVDEERFVGHQRFLLAYPVDGVVGHVLGEVVSLLRGAIGFDGNGVVVDRGEILVRLSADESVEVIETASSRPLTEWPHRARLPHRYLVALAELRR